MVDGWMHDARCTMHEHGEIFRVMDDASGVKVRRPCGRVGPGRVLRDEDKSTGRQGITGRHTATRRRQQRLSG